MKEADSFNHMLDDVARFLQIFKESSTHKPVQDLPETLKLRLEILKAEMELFKQTYETFMKQQPSALTIVPSKKDQQIYKKINQLHEEAVGIRDMLKLTLDQGLAKKEVKKSAGKSRKRRISRNLKRM